MGGWARRARGLMVIGKIKRSAEPRSPPCVKEKSYSGPGEGYGLVWKSIPVCFCVYIPCHVSLCYPYPYYYACGFVFKVRWPTHTRSRLRLCPYTVCASQRVDQTSKEPVCLAGRVSMRKVRCSHRKTVLAEPGIVGADHSRGIQDQPFSQSNPPRACTPACD